MPSSVRAAAMFENWNRKLHYYIGLYFLFFLWLFLLTGLMLNHGQWRLAQTANQRRESRFERTIQVLAASNDIDRARNVAQQLGLVGEIELPATPQQPNRFDFNIARPKDANSVRFDLTTG